MHSLHYLHFEKDWTCLLSSVLSISLKSFRNLPCDALRIRSSASFRSATPDCPHPSLRYILCIICIPERIEHVRCRLFFPFLWKVSEIYPSTRSATPGHLRSYLIYSLSSKDGYQTFVQNEFLTPNAFLDRKSEKSKFCQITSFHYNKVFFW